MGELNALGKRVRELRRACGMTQGALAMKVGVSTNSISQFEKGNLRPSLETLSKLSATLGEDLRVLLPRIGAFPVASTEYNVRVPIIMGNQYNRLKWDYLRRDESALPDPATEANYALSETSYEYGALTLPSSMLEPGVHRIFPMPGNAMAPTFESGDLLLFRLLDPSELDKIDKEEFPISNEEIDALSVYAIESQRATGISMDFGRFAFDVKRQMITCYYDNRSGIHSIPLAEVKAIWKFQFVLSKRSPNLAGKLRDLEYHLSIMEQKVKNLERQLSQAQDGLLTGTFRERLKEIIIGQMVTENDPFFDAKEIANDKQVRAKYIGEYGPIVDEARYYINMQPFILSLVRELEPQVKAKIAAQPGRQDRRLGLRYDNMGE